MPEEPITPAEPITPPAEPITPAAAPVVPAAPIVPESYVNADGTFKEGWRDHVVPDDFKGRPCYDAIGNDIQSVMKHIGNQDIAISKQGKGVFVPGPEASQTEKDMFYKAIGRPDTPEGYEFTVPDDVKEYYETDEVMLTQAKAAFHEVGLTKQQFTAVMAMDAMRLKASEEAMKADPMSFYEQIMPLVQPLIVKECEDALDAKWGDAKVSRLHYANMAITECYPEGEERDAVLAKYGSDPVFADAMATMYLKSHTESNGVDTSLGNGATSQNLDQRIATISKELTQELKLSNRTRYEALLAEKGSLFKQKYPEK